MKKTLLGLFIFISFVPSLAFAEEVKFYTLEWEAALAKAKKEHKYIFIDAYTDWCGWCKVMDKNTFSDAAVAEKMENNFVPLKLDMEEGFGKKLAMKYRVMAFPTFLVFTGSGKLVRQIIGYHEPKKFLAALDEALDPNKQLDLKGVSDNIEMEFPQFYQDAFSKGKLRKNPDDATVSEWVSSQKNPFSEQYWSVIYRFNTDEKTNQWVLENKKKLTDLYGKDDVSMKLSNIFGSKLQKIIKDKDEEGLTNLASVMKKYGNDDADEMILQYTIRYHESTQQWKKFTDDVQKYIDTKGFENPMMVNNYAWTLYEKCEDQDCIQKAVAWQKVVVEKDPQYGNLDTYAALLYKVKNYDEAITWAKKAIETGKKNKEDTKETENLLERIELGKSLHSK